MDNQNDNLLQEVKNNLDKSISIIKKMEEENQQVGKEMIEKMDAIKLKLQKLSQDITQTCAGLDQDEKEFEKELDKVISEEEKILG
ncbi:MAG TPA: hypothetical protein ENL06_03015 [Candidatus Portnoybacteria bacterium]|nr:hypothetical protein [Candidatus Portnoybacteria bacterium]